MKKRWISLVLAFVLLLSLCAGNNSFWYRPSDGTPVSTFPNLGSGPDDPPDPSGGWEIPEGGEWVVFSIDGKIILPGSSGIDGKTGTNATGKIGGDFPVKMTGSAYVAPEDLWIGPDADPLDVVFVSGTWLPWGPDYHSKVNNLSDTLSFPLPDWLVFSFPDVPQGLPEREDINAGWYPIPEGGFILPADGSGHYDSIRVQNELTVQVGDNDLVLDIDSLDVSGNFKVERNGSGRLFLFVNDYFSLSGSGKISGDAEDGDFIFLYYLAEGDFNTGGSTQFNGSLFCSQANIGISGSARMGNIVTAGESVNLSGASISVKNIYATQANVALSGSASLEGGGIITGGQEVELTGGAGTIHYLYAPLAEAYISNNSPSISGTAIVKNLEMGEGNYIEGPPATAIPIPELPVPVYEGSGGGGLDIPADWLVFSVDGEIKLDNSAEIDGKTGTNATGKIGGYCPVYMGNSAYITPEELWIGPGADPSDVVELKNRGDDFVQEYLAKVNNLSDTLSFPLPDWMDFTFPDVPEGLPGKANIVGGETIPEDGSGHYDSINISNSKTVTVQVGDSDLVLDIDSLEIGNSATLKVERNGTGRLFLFVNNSFSLSNSSKISGGAEDEDSIFLYYLGTAKFKPANSSQFNASLFCSQADIDISNSARMGNIVTKGQNVDLNNSSLSVKHIYATRADITFHNSATLEGGVITGGEMVELKNSVSLPGYLYAPLANTTLHNSASIHGTTIVKNLYMGNSSLIQGPPVMTIPPLVIPVPIYE